MTRPCATDAAAASPNVRKGALQIVNGKAKIIKETYCDGLGGCLGQCPQGAISVTEREAEPFDEKEVPLPNDRRSAMAELQYEAGMYQSLYENAVETCATMALEQRCDRDTPWDLACTTIAEKIRDLALSSTERNTMLIPNTRASGFLRGRRSEDD